ncbi:MAG: hypothetical protein M9944_12810 [Rhizobiaceae bacterium]|nr:hypothetical protein [Rhizobiaceae bacterium]
MVRLETSRVGNAERALERLEAKYGISRWQLDHLRKNKAKTCEVSLYARLRAAFADHCGRHAARLLAQAEAAQAVEHDEDVAAIQDQIRALAAKLEALKGAKKEARAVK